MAEKHTIAQKVQHPPKNPPIGRTRRVIRSGIFAKLYASVSLVILLATTVFWALLSAKIQRGNADQLVDPYLFEHGATFHGALFPGQHTFLLKWPVFLAVRLFGATTTAFTVATIGLAVVTVAALAACIYFIERRPLVFGTICLALASSLLLVPAQPYAGGLLPVNLAMLATRNIEYIFYLASLVLITRSRRVKSWRFCLAVVLMGTLIVSDKLFLPLSLGAALLALVVYALLRRWSLVELAVHWLLAGILAAAVAALALSLIAATGLTHISGQGAAGPYGLVHGLKNLSLGGMYAVLGFLTNFGANPAFSATTVRSIPHQALSHLLGLGGITYALNAIILAGGLFAVWQLLRSSLVHRSHPALKPNTATKLSIMLMWTTLVALGLFVVSDHYYAVDARYLTIALFTVFISAATYLRTKQWPVERLVLAGAILTVGLLLGLGTALRTYHDDSTALTSVSQRNTTVAEVMAHHPADVLVGDYWRVIPIKQAASRPLTVLPLADCSRPRDTLSSTAWQPNLATHSFAYLLSLDRGLTDYPACTLEQAIKNYGRPNASVLIAGKLNQPKELLLFYDHGSHHSAPKLLPQTTSTVLPVPLDQLPHTACAGPTIMNIVAHQDDDLLFMNPDLIHDIRAGHCVRTVYITAGDAGNSAFYWLSREQGSEAAYDYMDGPSKDVWVQRIVRLSDHAFITVANPRGNSKLSLIFMHLPDGNINGRGFKSSHYESLARLEGGAISALHSVDGQSTYNSSQLESALSALMQTYQPSEIRTQANYIGTVYPDHSDHMAVGRYVQRAYRQYETQQFENQVVIPIKYYIGYPTRQLPENVSGQDLADKEAVFFAYAQFDSGVCGSIAKCQETPTYNTYLHRQYQNPT